MQQQVCNLHLDRTWFTYSAQVQVAYLLLHPAPTCAVRLAPTLYLHSIHSGPPLHANRCWCPVPLTFSNLCCWCFSFLQLAQTLYLHSGWLLSANCTGGLVHRSIGAYTACADCNLHCVVVVVVVVVILYSCSDLMHLHYNECFTVIEKY